MAAQVKKVFVAGANGQLGRKIVTSVLAKDPSVHLDLLVRKGHDDYLASVGGNRVTFVKGDLSSADFLTKALEGMDVVISAVIGGHDVIIEGQSNLLQACKATGVKRFVPSDFSAEYRLIPEGMNPMSNMRKHFAETVKQSGVPYTFVNNGVFTEVLFSPWAQMFDLRNKKVSFWGDGNQKMDMTTYDDTARYVAETIFDPSTINTYFTVAADIKSFNELVEIYESLIGEKVTVERLGTVDQLKETILERKAKDPNNLMSYLGLMYQWGMVSGLMKFHEFHHQKYPHITPTTATDYIKQLLHQ